MNITVIGTIFTDIKGHPYGAFIPDGRNAGYIEYVHGGVGRNIAEDLANLGANARFVSLAEPGGSGDDIITGLERAGVDTRFIPRKPRGSGTWLAVFDEKGDVVSSVSARADLAPLAAVLDDHHEEIFSDADLIILEIDIDAKAVEKTFEYAGKYGKRVCCAVATMSHALDKKEFLKKAELFICNSQEAGMLFDKDLSGFSPGEMLEEIKQQISASGLKGLIVTMAEKGSVYASADGQSGICPAVPAEAADSTGAGDSYCAGLCAALCRGTDLSEACLTGAETASCVVSCNENIYTGPKRF